MTNLEALARELLKELQNLRNTIQDQLSPQNVTSLTRLFSPNHFDYSRDAESSRVFSERSCRVSDIHVTNLQGADIYVHIFNMGRVPSALGGSCVMTVLVESGKTKGIPELGGVTMDQGLTIYASTSATTLTAASARMFASVIQ